MSSRTPSWIRGGAGIALCGIPTLLSNSIPIHANLFGGLPGGGQLFGIVAIVAALAIFGRAAYRRLADTAPDIVTAQDVAVAADSDTMWQEFDHEAPVDEPAAV